MPIRAVRLPIAQVPHSDADNAIGRVITLGGLNEFIEAGKRKVQLDEMNVSTDKIVQSVKKVSQGN